MTQQLNTEELSFAVLSEASLQSIEAEESILGGLLIDPNAISRIQDKLKPEMFYINSHRNIYKAILLLAAENKPTDLLMVTQKLLDNGLLDSIGGRNKLGKLVFSSVSAVNIDAFADLVAEKYQRRELIKVSQEIKLIACQQDVDLSEGLLKSAELINEVGGLMEKRKNPTSPISDILVEAYQDIADRQEGAVLPGIASGFYDLDAMTAGFQRSDLIIIGARPSMGKTSLCLNIAYNIAAEYKLPVLIFSLEMSKGQLVQRLLASEAGIESTHLRSGKLNQAQWDSLSRAIGKLAEVPLHINDKPDITITQMRQEARRLQAEQGKELGLIIIDYLQLMEGTGDNRVQELSKITRGLKGLARELRVPVIALSQLSRAVETRTNKRPMLSDLRESGSIEQDADLVIMLYREEYYLPDTPERGIAEVIIAKHRNGPTGTVKLLFDSEFTKFKNKARSKEF